MAWNIDNPAMANQIGNDVPDIEENFQYLYDLLTVREMWLPARTILYPASSEDAGVGLLETASYLNNAQYLSFVGNAHQWGACVLTMPPNWNRGTIKAKFYWTSATGATAGDTVEWSITAGAVSNNDTLDTDFSGSTQVISDALLADNGTKLQISGATPAVTVAGTPALGDLIYIKIGRNHDGTDDMTEAAYLFGVVIQYSVTNVVSAW